MPPAAAAAAMVGADSVPPIQQDRPLAVVGKMPTFIAFAIAVLVAISFLLGRVRKSKGKSPWRRWAQPFRSKEQNGSEFTSREEQQRRAKQSFSVRKTDLVRIGRGEPTGRERKNAARRRRRGQQQQGGGGTLGNTSRTNGGSFERTSYDEGRSFGNSSNRSNSSWTGSIANLFSWPKPSICSIAQANQRAAPSTTTTSSTPCTANESNATDNASSNNLDGVAIMGMDCEMVGAGRDGRESLLARCSIVMHVASRKQKQQQQQSEPSTSDSTEAELIAEDDEVRTVYDKYVRPTKAITDYRTQWSGITRDHLRGEGDLPVVSFDVCRKEVLDLFASYEGKPVVVVGHALKNDFDVLRLRHPFSLTRDTATYRPFMREGRTQRRMVQRKLSHLAEEELGLTIQNSSRGHSSVEDATATLHLYWKHRHQWEKSLGYPLRSYATGTRAIASSQSVDGEGTLQGTQRASGWQPVTLYLDGCNLPLGVRCNNRLKGDGYQIISKTSTRGTQEVYRQIDWIPVFKSALASSSLPAIDRVVIMFDGAKYANSKKENRRPPSLEISPNIFLETTEIGVQVDDVLVERCSPASSGDDDSDQRDEIGASGPIVSVEDVVDTLNDMSDLGFGSVDVTESDRMDSYVVVRRKGGGSKTNRKLFDKLHLRRPEEGALCLPGLTTRLQKNSLKIARELQRARVHGVVEYELRPRDGVRSLVVTDDVLLTDRLVKQNVIVLSYRQLQQMF